MSIKIKIFGNELGAGESSDYGPKNESAKSYELSSFRGSYVKEHVVEIKDDDITEFRFTDDTLWYAKTDEIPELFGSLNRSNDDVIEIPTHLNIPGNDRSVASKVFVKLIQIFQPKVVKESALKLAEKIETQVMESEGLNFITEEFKLISCDNTDKKSSRFYSEDKPFLLFIHGTGSSTTGSFSEMKGSAVWTNLCKKYGHNILALEHRTWSHSPLQNAIDLLKAIPENATLHMVSHSRGGIVGDVLTRCGDRSTLFSDKEMEYLTTLERTADVENMQELNKLALAKNIKVEKFIRVACPAAGTTILSKRLDIFLNVLLNLVGFGLGQKANPIFVGIKTFLEGVIDERNDPSVLPGLEAMIPDSPLMEIINGFTYKTNTELRIIAGSAAAGGVKKTLAYILTRLYYWHDNDYVVDTDSMFLGARTHSTAQYRFVTGEEVDHFSYFKNKDTQESIFEALNAEKGQSIKHFKLVKEGEQNRAIINLPGGEVLKQEPTGKKPIVILLPGTMGSNLYDKNDVVWINFIKMAFGALKKLDLENQNIEAKSLVESSYGKIIQKLQHHFDVVDFPYDWRKSMTEAGAKLNEKVEQLLELNQPIRLIGHSMGGLVIRDLMINHSDTWTKLSQNPSFRCLLLGTPWRGSYLIPEIITGKGPTIKKLDKLAVFQSKKRLLQVFSRYNGLLELLPLFGHDFADMNLWKALHKVTKGKGWVLPTDEDLTKFKTYKEKVLRALGDIDGDDDAKLDLSKVFYIVGKADTTVSDFYFEERKRGKKHTTDPDEIFAMNPRRTDLEFDLTGAGDSSVPWEPTLKGFVRENIFYVNTTHGELANDEKLFDGFIELLDSGKTRLMSQSKPLINSVKSRGVLTPAHILSNNPEDLIRDILGLKREKQYDYLRQKKKSQLKVVVKNGHLKYSVYPIIVGHFKDDGIVSAEWVINGLLDKKLEERHDMGLYPGEIGSNLVILPNEENKLGAIIAGLGDNEKLTPFLLSQTIEKSCLEYVFSLKDAKQLVYDKPLGVSSLFVGSGYASLSLSDSINAILDGIVNANKKIEKLDKSLPKIEVVEFFELYKFKTLNAFYVLSQMERGNNLYNISLESPIRNVEGSRSNIPIQEMNSWWVRITALLKREIHTGEVSFEFSAASGRARVSSRKVFSSQMILDALLEDSSHKKDWDPELAKTIFELLIPNDLKLFFRNQQNILLILDKTTAKYPWELLHYDNNASKPICTNAGMIRQLATSDDKRIGSPVANKKALIIGDPLLVGSDLPQLPAAQKEAENVNELLKANFYETIPIIRKSYKEIVIKLFDDYKVIHIASHGVIEYGKNKDTGILLSDNVVLTTKEINQNSSTPELVFINSCFMGQINPAKESHFRKKFDLAANIGTQFIENGVKAVVVAGWAVDDNAALKFAEVFYSKMLAGEIFADAVKAARSATYEDHRETNTWGAYHAYGDQFYRLTDRKSGRDEDSPYISEIEIMGDLEIYINNTNDSARRGKTRNQKMEIRAKLEDLSKKIDASGLRNTEVTELEAKAYGEIELYEMAISKYQSLLDFDNAKFSLKSLEQLNNLRAAYIIDLKLKLDLDNEISAADRKAKLGEFKFVMDDVIDDLGRLNKLGQTRERLNLLGSAHKRNVFLLPTLKAKRGSLKKMASNYKKAFLLNNQGLEDKNIYPLCNWLLAEFMMLLDNNYEVSKEDQIIADIQEVFGTTITEFLDKKLEQIRNANNDQQGFWDLIELVNVFSIQLFFCDTAELHQQLLKEIKSHYTLAWNIAGSHRTKKSELVHVEFLKNYLNAIEATKAKRRKKRGAELQKDEIIKYRKKEITAELRKAAQELIGFYNDLE